MDLGAEEPEQIEVTQLYSRSSWGKFYKRLVGKIKGKEVSFLIDMRAIHNFIDPLTIERLGLVPENLNPLQVTIAYGEKISGGAYCRSIKIHIQGCITETDLLVIPLGDSQIIFGNNLVEKFGTKSTELLCSDFEVLAKREGNCFAES